MLMSAWTATIDKIEAMITRRPNKDVETRNIVMLDIPTSPATEPPSAAIQIPPYLQPLKQRLDETKADDLIPVCEWLGVPTPEQMPTPGQAKTWHKDEWMEWSKDNGFAYEGETTHSWTWKHPLANALTLSVAKTPGDFRTPMAMATQSRRAVREWVTAANVIVRSLFLDLGSDGPMAVLSKTMDETKFKADLVAAVQCKDDQARNLIMRLQYRSIAEDDLSKTLTDLVNILGRITKDFDIPPGKIMGHLLCSNQADGQAEWERMKLFEPNHPISFSMVAEAKDYLDSLREMERAEKEEKRMERDREDEEREARRQAKLRPKTTQEVIQAQVDSRDATTQAAIKSAIGAAMSTIDRLRALETHIIKGFQVPAIEDPVPLVTALATKTAQIVEIEQKLEEERKLVEQQRVRIVELETKVNEVAPERIAKLEDVEQHLVTLASIVVSSIEDAKNSTNPFQQVNILTKLSDDAKSYLNK